jgi:hypothetical protein
METRRRTTDRYCSQLADTTMESSCLVSSRLVLSWLVLTPTGSSSSRRNGTLTLRTWRSCLVETHFVLGVVQAQAVDDLALQPPRRLALRFADALRKTPFLLNFSLCLYRACLGKWSVF